MVQSQRLSYAYVMFMFRKINDVFIFVHFLGAIINGNIKNFQVNLLKVVTNMCLSM